MCEGNTMLNDRHRQKQRSFSCRYVTILHTSVKHMSMPALHGQLPKAILACSDRFGTSDVHVYRFALASAKTIHKKKNEERSAAGRNTDGGGAGAAKPASAAPEPCTVVCQI